MNKSQQIQHMSYRAGTTRGDTEKVLVALSEMIKAALSGQDGLPVVGKSVKVEGIGTFKIRLKKAKQGQNPQVAEARKAEAEGTLTDDQKALLEKVAKGEVQEVYNTPASTKITWRPEKAVKTWSTSGAVPETEPTVEEEGEGEGDEDGESE